MAGRDRPNLCIVTTCRRPVGQHRASFRRATSPLGARRSGRNRFAHAVASMRPEATALRAYPDFSRRAVVGVAACARLRSTRPAARGGSTRRPGGSTSRAPHRPRRDDAAETGRPPSLVPRDEQAVDLSDAPGKLAGGAAVLVPDRYDLPPVETTVPLEDPSDPVAKRRLARVVAGADAEQPPGERPIGRLELLLRRQPECASAGPGAIDLDEHRGQHGD
jgi:hypothetical protein